MIRPFIRIHDIATDKVTDREMNNAEFEQFEAQQAEMQAQAEIDAAHTAEKAALLARLGITDDEAKLLLS